MVAGPICGLEGLLAPGSSFPYRDRPQRGQEGCAPERRSWGVCVTRIKPPWLSSRALRAHQGQPVRYTNVSFNLSCEVVSM